MEWLAKNLQNKTVLQDSTSTAAEDTNTGGEQDE
jgi:hypothetical protein